MAPRLAESALFAASMVFVALQKLRSNTRCHSSGVSEPGGTDLPLPTLQTSTSRPPSAAVASATTLEASSGWDRSPTKPTASVRSAAAAWRSLESRPFSAMRQPSRCRARAIAWPIPRDEPVTRADFPARPRFTTSPSPGRRAAVTAARSFHCPGTRFTYPLHSHLVVGVHGARVISVGSSSSLQYEITGIIGGSNFGKNDVKICGSLT